MANYYNINRVVEGYELRTIDPNDGQLKNINDIFASDGGGGGGGDLSNYVRLTGASSQVISGNLTVVSTFQSPNISTQFLNLRDLDTTFKINRGGAEIIDIIPDPLDATNSEIRFHYDLEQQIGTKIRNYT